MKKIFFTIVILLFWFQTSYSKDNFPFLGEINTKNVIIRAGPNVNFELLYKLKIGQRLIIYDKLFSWLKVLLPKEASVFIYSSYLKPLKTKDKGIVIANRVNIRARPNINSTILTQVNKNQALNLIEKEGQWYKIEPPKDAYGWVKEDYINFISYNIAKYRQELRMSDEPKKITKNLEFSKLDKKTKEKRTDQEFSAIGTIRPFFKLFGQSNRYKLLIDNKLAYILEAEPAYLKKFISMKTKIFGKIKNKSSDYGVPIITVTKIELLK